MAAFGSIPANDDLDITDVTVPDASIAEAKVSGLVADLAAKATDASVVHLAGAETVSGAKTFSADQRFTTRIGVGSAPDHERAFDIRGDNPSDTTSAYGAVIQTKGTTAHTANVVGFRSLPGTTASAYTVTKVVGVGVALLQGAGSTVTSYYGIEITGNATAVASYGVAIGAHGTQTLWVSHDADSTSASGGVAFGLSRDTNLYRSAADTLKTDDAFVAASASIISGGSTSFAKVGGAIFDHSADAGNSGTSETDLYSDSIAASTLNTNNHKIVADYDGIFAATAATKQLKVYFGGTVVFDTGALAVSASLTGWSLRVKVIRVSSSVVRVAVTYNGAIASPPGYAEVTGLTLTDAQVLKIAGTAGIGGASNDIVAKMATGYFHPAA